MCLLRNKSCKYSLLTRISLVTNNAATTKERLRYFDSIENLHFRDADQLICQLRDILQDRCKIFDVLWKKIFEYFQKYFNFLPSKRSDTSSQLNTEVLVKMWSLIINRVSSHLSSDYNSFYRVSQNKVLSENLQGVSYETLFWKILFSVSLLLLLFWECLINWVEYARIVGWNLIMLTISL